MLSAAGIFIHKISFTQILEGQGGDEFAENKKHYLENVPTDIDTGFVDGTINPSRWHISL